jgi:hypothetical protein
MSSDSCPFSLVSAAIDDSSRPWDARLARRLVAPLKDSWVAPNHLTTVRLAVGLAAAYAFTGGSYAAANLAALIAAVDGDARGAAPAATG